MKPLFKTQKVGKKLLPSLYGGLLSCWIPLDCVPSVIQRLSYGIKPRGGASRCPKNTQEGGRGPTPGGVE